MLPFPFGSLGSTPRIVSSSSAAQTKKSRRLRTQVAGDSRPVTKNKHCLPICLPG